MGQLFACFSSTASMAGDVPETAACRPLERPEKVEPVLSVAYVERFRKKPHGEYDLQLLTEVYGEFVGVFRVASAVVVPRDGDLRFAVGDCILILRIEDVDWGFGTNLSAGERSAKNEGYILLTQLVEESDKPQSHCSWFEVSRPQAETLLLLPGLEEGTYLLRACFPPNEHKIMLSVRTRVFEEWQIRHYGITYDQQNYYVTESRMHASITKLLHDCASNDNVGLACRLSKPCPRNYWPAYMVRQLYLLHGELRVVRRLVEQAPNWYEARLCDLKGTAVAVHVFERGRLRDDKFLTMVRSMRGLRHQNVIKLVAVVLRSKTEPHFAVFEMVHGRNLQEYLRADKWAKVSPSALLDFCVQIASGMAHLEAQSVVHGDVRAANMLLGDACTVKVAGFSLATFTSISNDNGGLYGSKWSAPELWQTRQFTHKTDIWSFGVLLFEVATRGREPYEGKSAVEAQKFVANGNRLAQPRAPHDYCPQELFKLISACWKTAAHERPAFSYLYNNLHSMFLTNEIEFQSAV